MPLKTPAPRPTEGELVILQALWNSGPQSVREILHILQAARPTGYTTVLKTLQIMTGKDLVERDETVRPQIYRVRHSREHTQKHMLTDLLDRAFGGSVKTLVLQALSARKSSEAELKQIEQLLDSLEADAAKGVAK